MVVGLLTKSSNIMLRREILNLSPSPAATKSLYLPSARVCFGRNNNYNNALLSSSGVNHKLNNKFVIACSIPPLPNSSCSSRFENKNNPCIFNNQHSIITVSNKIGEIKKKVIKLLVSLLLFGFLAFITTPRSRSLQNFSALAATSPSSSSTSTSSTSCTDCNCTESSSICTCSCHIAEIIAYSMVLTSFLGFVAVPLSIGISLVLLVAYFMLTLLLVKILVIVLALCIMVPPVVALVNGFLYFLQLCKDDKKSLLVLQVGVQDNMRELQNELAQTADTFDLDGMKLQGVMKSLLQHYDSCHFAHLTVNQCISDEETKYGEDNDEMDSIWADSPLAYYKMLKFFIKELVVIIHWALKTIKKINYDGKYSKQLFREVLTEELVRYDRDKETFANVDGMKYVKAVGEEHGMVDDNYLVVTILVLASGVYSVSPLVCNTEHVKTVLQEFNTIPKKKVESVEVLWTPKTEDIVVSKQEVQRDFPQLKPVNFSGSGELVIVS